MRVPLELAFEYVVVSHGRPIHDCAAYDEALELPPFTGVGPAADSDT